MYSLDTLDLRTTTLTELHPYRISPSEAKPVLEQFLADMLLEIENTVVKIDADQS